MGKPRMIILIRHAQSEGNKNRDIHQYVPDHRVKLTPDGQTQALDAGRRLRALLKPDDTIQFFTSPYRRTRETTEGILKTLTGTDDEFGPSPFPRDKIKVYEEPRLREQDFGNFQPCSAEMERMWQERADYGHFFYRIPSGESAADAYDRVSGFNESLWRQFGDADFPSVCVLVTHGLMTRIFLMKWYHWSVEYFEDLRNINHCEFITMKRNDENGKFVLQNELRTWSDLKRKAQLANKEAGAMIKAEEKRQPRMWGGCAMGCDHARMEYPRRPRRQNTQDFISTKPTNNDKEDHSVPSRESDQGGLKKRSSVRSKSNLATSVSASAENASPIAQVEEHHHDHHHHHHPEPTVIDPSTAPLIQDGSDADDADHDSTSPIPSPPQKPSSSTNLQLPIRHKGRPNLMLNKLGRDFGGSQSGLGSPNDVSDEADDSDWFDTNVHQFEKRMSFSQSPGVERSNLTRSALSQINETMFDKKSSSPSRNGASPIRQKRSGSLGRSARNRSGSLKGARKATRSEKEMIADSGMMVGRRADALGDMDDEEVVDQVEAEKLRERKTMDEIY